MDEISATPPPDAPPSQPNPSRSKKRRVIVWLVVLLFFAGLFTWVVRLQNAPKEAAQGRRAAMAAAPSP